MIKKVIQQGRSDFDARSVLPVREHDKMARTPLVAFFNILILERFRVTILADYEKFSFLPEDTETLTMSVRGRIEGL